MNKGQPTGPRPNARNAYRCDWCHAWHNIGSYPRHTLKKRKGKWVPKSVDGKGRGPKCTQCKPVETSSDRFLQRMNHNTGNKYVIPAKRHEATTTHIDDLEWLAPRTDIPEEYKANLAGYTPNVVHDEDTKHMQLMCTCGRVFLECNVDADVVDRTHVLHERWRVHRRCALECDAYPINDIERRWRRRVMETLHILLDVMDPSERFPEPRKMRIHSQHWLYPDWDTISRTTCCVYEADNEYEPLLHALEAGLWAVGWMNVNAYENREGYDEHDIIELIIQTLKRREVRFVNDAKCAQASAAGGAFGGGDDDDDASDE